MKNLFLPLLLLAVAMSSCTDDEISSGDYTQPDSDDLVSINVYAGTTKGTDTVTTTLEASTILLHIDDADGVSSSYSFSCTSSDWSQEGDDVDKIAWSDIVFPASFYSMHDGVTSKELIFDDSKAQLVDYTVSGASVGHNDLVYYASMIEAIPVGGTLSAYHKHALSKVNFYAKTGTNMLYIAKLTLKNVDGVGTVTITPEDDDSSSILWENGTSNDASYQYYYIGDDIDATPSAITSTGTTSVLIDDSEDAPMMIIPQTTSTSSESSLSFMDYTYVEVIYYLTSSTGAPLVGFSEVSERTDADKYVDENQGIALYVKAGFKLAQTFDPNQVYNISLGLGADNTSGGILIDDFYVDKNGNEVELTLKNGCGSETVEIPDIDEGDDVLENVNSDIDIEVDIDKWGDSNTSTL